ncbi:uncharacterized protein LOC128862483 [Anastrepha ludens]|uniref:uncharacterized protein LOC128862483 n=1 Tax=Anastrepha ludens TaxID=28586 RepID=UPI0023B1948F|nr:uncharacterized protein LOC128862483 [Anastrepha ludens]
MTKLKIISGFENNFVEDASTIRAWVQNFRTKRSQMKKKHRGDLRVNAMLNTALLTAEADLCRKQNECFRTRLMFQQRSEKGYVMGHVLGEERAKQRETINNIWKSEINDLDSFMRSLNSSNRSCGDKTTRNENTYNLKSDNSSTLQYSIAVVS